MEKRRTQLLLALLFSAAAATVVCCLRLDRARESAQAAAHDLALVRRDVAAIAAARSGAGGAAVLSGDVSDLHRRLGEASTAAEMAKLVGIEVGPWNRLGNTDYQELAVFLRLEPVTLRQLTLFLHELAKREPGSRAKMIELGPPQNGIDPGAWTADVTVTYLAYAPKETERK